MAVYATLADAEALYGSPYVAVACDRDGDGSVDPASFDRHLAVASRQIDGYLLGRYGLPLTIVPDHFVKLCVDLAVSNACSTADVRTRIIDQRAKEAIDYLELIANNKVKLEIAPNTTTANISTSPSLDIGRVIAPDPGSRQMTRNKLDGVL